MRIALVTHKFARGDGQGRVNYELARAALDAGHTVFLVASEVAPDLVRHPLAKVVTLGVRGVPTALLQNQVFAWRATFWLWRWRKSVDVVHANGFTAWTRTDVSTSHFVHGAWVRSPFHIWRVRRDAYGFYQLLYTYTGKWLEKWCYARAQIVVAVSSQVRGELIAVGVPPRRVRVIPNGVDTDEFTPGRTDRAKYGCTAANVLLFIGDIRTPRKNLDTLLRALNALTDTCLIVIGDRTGSPYPRLAQQLGLAERVSFLGYRRDVSLIMHAADLFVFPSRYEACSLVLLEAAAAGLPVVAARTTGGAELLTPGCSVVVDDPEDASQLAAVLNRLLSDRAELARMGEEARRVALANSWQVMAQRYLELYSELASTGEVRGCRNVRSNPRRRKETC